MAPTGPLIRFDGSEQLQPVISVLSTLTIMPKPDCSLLHSNADYSPSESGISRIPVELTLKIIDNLDLKSALNLAKSSKGLRKIYDAYRDVIILSLLKRELSPFDELLQFVVAEPEDINVPLGPCLRRRIYHNGRLMSDGEPFDSDCQSHTFLGPVMLGEEHFSRILKIFRVTKGWEQLFTRYRFSNASDCRELYPHEAQRLRGALYRWMAFAQYFHGDLQRPNRWIPQRYSTDVRCKQIRLLSDTQLHELEDLWKTIRVVVEKLICPSTELVLREMDWSISKEAASRIGFGSSTRSLMRATFNWNDSTFVDFDTNVNTAIVDTFLKLTPGELLHFANNRSLYSKERLVREVRLANPRILEDRQSLSHALAAVMEEREQAYTVALSALNVPVDIDLHIFSLSDRSSDSGYSGGILDHVHVDDLAAREVWNQNAHRAQLDNFSDLGLRIAMNGGRLEP